MVITALTDIPFLLRVSEDCTRIVAADRSSNIAVWTKSQVSDRSYREFFLGIFLKLVINLDLLLQFHCSLPKHSSAPTAFAINDSDDTVVVAYADHKVLYLSSIQFLFCS